jgi:ComEC/Rec2-related protein
MNQSARILPSMPLLPLVAAIAVGELWAYYVSTFMLYGAAALAALCCFMAWQRLWHWVPICLFAIVGMLAMMIATPTQPDSVLFSSLHRYHAVVRNVHSTPYNQQLEVACSCSDGLILVKYHSVVPPIEPGDTVAFTAKLEHIGTNSVPGESTQQAYARRNGIVAYCHVSSLTLLGEGTGWRNRLWHWQRDASDFIYDRLNLNDDTAAMLNAVLIGNVTELPNDVRKSFASAGLAHVLALSGTHVAILIAILSLLLLPLRLLNHRKVASVAITVLLVAYALFTGASPSVVRAVTMAVVVIVAGMLRRGSSALNNLCFAALLILVVSPRSLFSPGFQLSFAAVAAILMFSFELTPRWRAPLIVRWLIAMITVSLSAVIGTGALAAWHFHQMPIYFLLSNLPIAVLLPCFMGCGMILIVLQMAHLPIGWLSQVCNGLHSAMTWIADVTAHMPGATINHVYFEWWWLVPYYVALILLWLAIKRQRRVYLYGGVSVALFTAIAVTLSARALPTTEAYAIDYHYAEALLLRHDGNVWVLTDASPKHHDEMAERLNSRLADFLDERRLPELQIVNRLNDGDAKMFYADDTHWIVGSTLFYLPKNDSDTIPQRLHAQMSGCYYLLSRQFKGNPAVLHQNAMKTDTILLSRAIYPTRLNEWNAELDSMNIPHRVGVSPFFNINRPREK